MAYNPGFPVSYQPYYPQAFQMPAQQNPQPAQANAGIIWVQGEAGAKSYLVAPNNTVQLWDSESQTIYLKSADASGMPSMKILDYTIRESAMPVQQPKAAVPTYATKGEIEAVYARIDALRADVDKLTKKEADEHE